MKGSKRFIFEKQADTEDETKCKSKLIPPKNAFSGPRKSNAISIT